MAAAAAIAVLPWLLFWWILPFVSGTTLGNDYVLYSIQHQMELMLSLKTGAFPLFVPGFAGGQSASALTLGGIWHPLAHAASAMPGYWDGKALEWNTFFRLLSLAGAHYALFAFLRRLRLTDLEAFALSAGAVYNLRCLDLFRFAASLESWTGFILLCSALGFYCLEESPLAGPLSIVGAAYWTLTGGHPQAAYYGMLGAVLFALAAPFLLAEILPGRDAGLMPAARYWVRALAWMGAGTILASAYLVPFYLDFVVENAERVGQSYAWADAYRDTLAGTLDNFTMPLRSDVHGAFGGPSLFLAAALLPALALARVRIPRVVWLLWGLCLLVFLHLQGGRTPVHFLTWRFLPLASSVRTAGRAAMLLPMFLTLILAWLLAAGERRWILSGAALLATVGWCLLPEGLTGGPSAMSPAVLRTIPGWVVPAWLLCGAACLACFGLGRALAAGLLLAAATAGQIGLVLPLGTWTAPKENTPTFAEAAASKRDFLDYQWLPGRGLYRGDVMAHLRWAPLEPSLARIARSCKPARDRTEAYAKLKEGIAPDDIVVEGSCCADASRGAVGAGDDASRRVDKVELLYASFNRLVFSAQTGGGGILMMRHPFSGRWRAAVDGKEAPLCRANGIAHALAVPAGTSRVEFRYHDPAAALGVGLTCCGLGLLALWVFLAGRAPLAKAAALCLAALAAAIYPLWRASLYNGPGLGTRYSWTRPPAGEPNLAYLKRTSASSTFLAPYPHLFGSGRGVDGDPAAGFATESESGPWWSVDLAKPLEVGALILHESRTGQGWNLRPITVKASIDGRKWSVAAVVTAPPRYGALGVRFRKPVRTRHLRVESSGKCGLAFDEVEVLPPSVRR